MPLISQVLSFCLALVLTAPLVLLALLSLSPTTGLDFFSDPIHASIDWWHQLLFEPQWLSALTTSLLIASLSTPFAVVIALPLSCRWRLYRDKVALAILIASATVLLFPPVVVALSATRLLQAVGLFDTVLGVAFVHGLMSLPVVALLFVSRLEARPIGTFEAARALGALPIAAGAAWLLAEHRATLVGAIAVGVLTSMSEATVTIFVTDTAVRPVTREALSGLTQDMSPTSFAAFSVWLLGAGMASLFLEKFLHRRPTNHDSH
ncbi:MAG: hypothetical protein Q8O33_14170 [Pseudomonadota bacterium]|nr:hypothetical protein [Pseudomonadota bacterium]